MYKKLKIWNDSIELIKEVYCYNNLNMEKI